MKNTYDKHSEHFSSNAVRLTGWEWLAVAGIIFALSVALPPVWRSLEAYSPPAEYRIPYDSSEDYWLFRQYCRSAGDRGRTLVIGDSVVWGHYVDRNQTLTRFLNDLAGEKRFVNLGLDGSHPMALYGLIRHYGKSIKKESIIIHLNLLWLSSQEADLQTNKEQHFNHPRLVPQFKPRIPCYTESASGRIGIVLERFLPALQLVRHLRISCFDNTDLQLWTVENPYSNPLGRIMPHSAGPAEKNEGDAQPKSDRIQARQSLPWIELDTSLQWWAVRQLLELLISRGNDVFVVVGPLNEHVLSPDALQKYKQLLKQAESHLKSIKTPYSLLPLLPAHLYADTSHPLPQGYALLAEHIWNRLER